MKQALLAHSRWQALAAHLMLVVGAVAILYPVLWMVATSFKVMADVVEAPAALIPPHPVIQHYLHAWQGDVPLGRYFLNSLIHASAVAVLDMATSTLAAFALTSLNLRGKAAVFGLILATMMVPPDAKLIPNFVTIKALSMYDSYWGLIVPFAANGLSIFLLRQAFLSLPKALYEAARVEGATPWQYLVRVGVPLVKPSIAVVGLLSFLRAWNDLLWPLVATSSETMRTVQVGLLSFSEHVSTNTPLLMAVATMVTLPSIAVFLFAQRQIIESVARSGLKG